MKDFINFIISSIVDQPEKVVIEEKIDPQTGNKQIIASVASQDRGKVIGKGGRIIKAIKNLIRAKTAITGEKCFFILKED